MTVKCLISFCSSWSKVIRVLTTSLLSGNSVAGDGGSLSDMLVVTTSVGMIDGVHGNTTGLGPHVALGLVLVHSARSLEEGLVGTGTTGNDTDHTTSLGRDDLLGSGGKLDAGLAGIGVVTNDGNVVTGRPSKRTTITSLLLDIGDNGSLGHGAERENVADGQRGLLSGVDELSSVHALVGDETITERVNLRCFRVFIEFSGLTYVSFWSLKR